MGNNESSGAPVVAVEGAGARGEAAAGKKQAGAQGQQGAGGGGGVAIPPVGGFHFFEEKEIVGGGGGGGAATGEKEALLRRHVGAEEKVSCMFFEEELGLLATGTVEGEVRLTCAPGMDITFSPHPPRDADPAVLQALSTAALDITVSGGAAIGAAAARHERERVVPVQEVRIVRKHLLVAVYADGGLRVWDIVTRTMLGGISARWTTSRITATEWPRNDDYLYCYLGTSAGDVGVVQLAPTVRLCAYRVAFSEVRRHFLAADTSDHAGGAAGLDETDDTDDVTAIITSPADAHQVLVLYARAGFVVWDLIKQKILRCYTFVEIHDAVLGHKARQRPDHLQKQESQETPHDALSTLLVDASWHHDGKAVYVATPTGYVVVCRLDKQAAGCVWKTPTSHRDRSEIKRIEWVAAQYDLALHDATGMLLVQVGHPSYRFCADRRSGGGGGGDYNDDDEEDDDTDDGVALGGTGDNVTASIAAAAAKAAAAATTPRRGIHVLIPRIATQHGTFRHGLDLVASTLDTATVIDEPADAEIVLWQWMGNLLSAADAAVSSAAATAGDVGAASELVQNEQPPAGADPAFPSSAGFLCLLRQLPRSSPEDWATGLLTSVQMDELVHRFPASLHVAALPVSAYPHVFVPAKQQQEDSTTTASDAAAAAAIAADGPDEDSAAVDMLPVAPASYSYIARSDPTSCATVIPTGSVNSTVLRWLVALGHESRQAVDSETGEVDEAMLQAQDEAGFWAPTFQRWGLPWQGVHMDALATVAKASASEAAQAAAQDDGNVADEEYVCTPSRDPVLPSHPRACSSHGTSILEAVSWMMRSRAGSGLHEQKEDSGETQPHAPDRFDQDPELRVAARIWDALLQEHTSALVTGHASGQLRVWILLTVDLDGAAANVSIADRGSHEMRIQFLAATLDVRHLLDLPNSSPVTKLQFVGASRQLCVALASGAVGLLNCAPPQPAHEAYGRPTQDTSASASASAGDLPPPSPPTAATPPQSGTPSASDDQQAQVAKPPSPPDSTADESVTASPGASGAQDQHSATPPAGGESGAALGEAGNTGHTDEAAATVAPSPEPAPPNEALTLFENFERLPVATRTHAVAFHVRAHESAVRSVHVDTDYNRIITADMHGIVCVTNMTSREDLILELTGDAVMLSNPVTCITTGPVPQQGSGGRAHVGPVGFAAGEGRLGTFPGPVLRRIREARAAAATQASVPLPAVFIGLRNGTVEVFNLLTGAALGVIDVAKAVNKAASGDQSGTIPRMTDQNGTVLTMCAMNLFGEPMDARARNLAVLEPTPYMDAALAESVTAAMCDPIPGGEVHFFVTLANGVCVATRLMAPAGGSLLASSTELATSSWRMCGVGAQAGLLTAAYPMAVVRSPDGRLRHCAICVGARRDMGAAGGVMARALITAVDMVHCRVAAQVPLVMSHWAAGRGVDTGEVSLRQLVQAMTMQRGPSASMGLDSEFNTIGASADIYEDGDDDDDDEEEDDTFGLSGGGVAVSGGRNSGGITAALERFDAVTYASSNSLCQPLLPGQLGTQHPDALRSRVPVSWRKACMAVGLGHPVVFGQSNLVSERDVDGIPWRTATRLVLRWELVNSALVHLPSATAMMASTSTVGASPSASGTGGGAEGLHILRLGGVADARESHSQSSGASSSSHSFLHRGGRDKLVASSSSASASGSPSSSASATATATAREGETALDSRSSSMSRAVSMRGSVAVAPGSAGAWCGVRSRAQTLQFTASAGATTDADDVVLSPTELAAASAMAGSTPGGPGGADSLHGGASGSPSAAATPTQQQVHGGRGLNRLRRLTLAAGLAHTLHKVFEQTAEDRNRDELFSTGDPLVEEDEDGTSGGASKTAGGSTRSANAGMTSGAHSAMADAADALAERGERIERIANKTANLPEVAKEFREHARRERERLERKNQMWPFGGGKK